MADTLDAMVSDRPYRTGMEHGSDIAELRRCAQLPHDTDILPGRDKEPRDHFDPRVVEAVQAALEGGLDPDATPDERAVAPHLAPRPKERLNCWESKKCGAEASSVGESGYCPVPFMDTLDGVNRGMNGGRACWSVVGAKCREGDTSAPPGGAPACANCDFLARVRREEGPGWFQLAPQVHDDAGTSVASLNASMTAPMPAPRRGDGRG